MLAFGPTADRRQRSPIQPVLTPQAELQLDWMATAGFDQEEPIGSVTWKAGFGSGSGRSKVTAWTRKDDPEPSFELVRAKARSGWRAINWRAFSKRAEADIV